MNRGVNMSTIEQWVKHGDEMRRPLLVHPKLGDSQAGLLLVASFQECAAHIKLLSNGPMST